jgi:UDP-glucose 4-epimerase
MNNQSKKILITGGFGNLGSWLTKYFSNLNYDVYVLSKNKHNILSEYNFTLISCDITNIEDCKTKLNNIQFEYVIHAASMNDMFVENYASLSLEINTKGTRNILETIDKSNLKNFIYLSTFHVYGVSEGFITEESPTLSRHDYATTHLFAEYFVKQFHYTHKLPYTIIRLTNSYGCPIDKNTSKWYLILNDLAKMAFEKHEIVLKGNGRVSRDFIWMGTVCEVLEKICALPTAPNDIFNLSGEQSFPMLEIANYVKQAALAALNIDLPITINTEDETVASVLEVSSAKLKSLINYTTSPKFKEEAKAIFNLLEKKLNIST